MELECDGEGSCLSRCTGVNHAVETASGRKYYKLR